jgi:hypothetical protein
MHSGTGARKLAQEAEKTNSISSRFISRCPANDVTQFAKRELPSDRSDGGVAEDARRCAAGSQVRRQGSAGCGRRVGHVQGLGRHRRLEAAPGRGRVVAHRPLRARRQRHPR